MHTAWGVVCVWGGGGELQRVSSLFMNRDLLVDAYFLCLFASSGPCTY